MGSPSMMPTETAETLSMQGRGLLPMNFFVAAPLDRLGERDVGARDRGRAGAAVGLQHVAVEHDRVLAEGLRVDDGAQAAADQARDLVGAAADLALDALAVHAGVRRRGAASRTRR